MFEKEKNYKENKIELFKKRRNILMEKQRTLFIKHEKNYNF